MTGTGVQRAPARRAGAAPLAWLERLPAVPGLAGVEYRGFDGVLAGRNATVFVGERSGQPLVVRVHFDADPVRHARFEALAAWRKAHPAAAETVVPVESLPDAAESTNGVRVDVSVMPMAEGSSLGYFVQDADSDALRRLAASFRQMVRTHERAAYAHGDKSCGNIFVGADGALQLIDPDTAWVAGLGEDAPPLKAGTPGFQHPRRMDGTDATATGPRQDRFSDLVIYVSLAILSEAPGLKTHATEDRLLFSPTDLATPSRSSTLRIIGWTLPDGPVKQLFEAFQATLEALAAGDMHLGELPALEDYVRPFDTAAADTFHAPGSDHEDAARALIGAPSGPSIFQTIRPPVALPPAAGGELEDAQDATLADRSAASTDPDAPGQASTDQDASARSTLEDGRYFAAPDWL